jgi:LPS-assembly protein
MISLVPFALALIATGQVPGGSPPGTESETAATSKKLDIDERTGTWHLKTDAVLNTGPIEIRADEMWFDPAEQRAIARGHVILFQENIVAFADEMNVQLTTGEADLVGGTVLQKRNVSPQALLKAKTREELEKLGQTTMSVTGRHVRRLGPDHFSVDGIAFTPCDCDPVKPSWRIKSLHADVIPGERAILTLPVIYIGRVPVLAFPWLYLPMADRRSGLLIPRWGTARSSFFLEQPVFLTFGRSYDATVVPGYYFGGGDPVGVKGPRLQTEFEYAPSVRTKGRATLDLLYDLSPRLGPDPNTLQDPTAPQLIPGTGAPIPGTNRGLRGSGSLRHDQDLGRGFYDRVDASFVSDGLYPQSLSADLITRETTYTESTAALYRRTASSYAGFDLGIRQDLRFPYGFFDTARTAGDFPRHGPNPLQRLPEFILDIPESRLSRLFFGSFRLEYSRLAPLVGRIGVDPVPTPSAQSGFAGAQFEARDRIDFRPRVSLPIDLGRFARLTPYAWYREDLYVGEFTGATSQRGYPVGGALLETELSRVFPTPNGTWRHSLTPSVEIRYVPPIFGRMPTVYDEIDGAVPANGFLEGVAQLSQKLVQSEAGGVRRFIRLDVGQGFDLKAGTAADAFARITGVILPFSAGLIYRYDFRANRLAQVSSNLGYDSGRGLALSISYDNLVLSGGDNLRRGIDELVGPPAQTSLEIRPFRAQTVNGHAGMRFKFGLGLAYDITVSPQRDSRCNPVADPAAPPPPAFCPADTTLTPTPWTILQQWVTVSINPSCDCWRLDVRALFRRDFILPDFRGNPQVPFKPDFFVTLTLAKFGSFGM